MTWYQLLTHVQPFPEKLWDSYIVMLLVSSLVSRMIAKLSLQVSYVVLFISPLHIIPRGQAT